MWKVSEIGDDYILALRASLARFANIVHQGTFFYS